MGDRIWMGFGSGVVSFESSHIKSKVTLDLNSIHHVTHSTLMQVI